MPGAKTAQNPLPHAPNQNALRCPISRSEPTKTRLVGAQTDGPTGCPSPVNNFYEKTIYNTENNCRIADFPVGHLRTGTPRRMQNPRILNKLSKDSTIQGSYKRPTLEGKKDFSWYAFCFTVDAEPT